MRMICNQKSQYQAVDKTIAATNGNQRIHLHIIDHVNYTPWGYYIDMPDKTPVCRI